MHQRKFHTLLFAFGVLMLLARPFMVYQLCEAGDFNKDPQRVYSLLQRLIKKKDDHHADDAEQVAVLESQKTRQLAPASFIVVFTRLFPFSSIRHLCSRLRATKLLVAARQANMICRFQI